MKNILIAYAVLAAAVVLGALGFIYSGVYNVAADQEVGALKHWILSTTMERSVEARLDEVDVPDLEREELIQSGATHYDQMCVHCHGAPGAKPGEIAQGLNPQPPELAKMEEDEDPAELFWVTKHGIEMTGMPAWGVTHDDESIWGDGGSDEALSEDWRAMQAAAYSRAYLRASAQAYREEDLRSAQRYLSQAVRLDPDLTANGGVALAAHLAAWTDLPKISDPVLFMERIYDNLPGQLSVLKRRRRSELAQIAVQEGFTAYRDGDLAYARTAIRRAIRYQPRWLANRGVLSILVRSHLPWLAESGASTNHLEQAKAG